jgi:hypothetical protein
LEKGRSRKEHDQANKGRGEQAQPCFYWLKTALQINLYGMARCPDTKSTRFSTNMTVLSSLFQAV